MAVSHDKEQLAAGSSDGSVCIWNPWTGQVITRWKGASNLKCQDVVFTPDGKYLLVAQGYSIHIWNVITSTHKQELEAHSSFVRSLALSPTGKQFASGGNDGAIFLWDIQSGELQVTLLPSEAHIHVLAVLYSKDGSYIFSGHSAYVTAYKATSPIRIWDAASGSQVGLLQGHTGRVNDLALADHDDLLVSASDDHTVRIWDVDLRKQVQLLEGHHACVKRVALIGHGSSSMVVSGDDQGFIRVWSAYTGSCLAHLHKHVSYITSITSLSDGSRVCSAAADRTVFIWSVDSFSFPPSAPKTSSLRTRMQEVYRGVKSVVKGSQQHKKEDVPEPAVSAATLSPDGSLLALGRQNGSIQLTTLHSPNAPRELILDFDPLKHVNQLSFSEDGAWLLSTCLTGVAQIWDVQTGNELAAFAETLKAALFPHKLLVAAVPTRRPWTIRVLVAESGQHALSLRDEEHSNNYIDDMQFSSDSSRLLSISRVGRCIVWDLINFSQLVVFSGPPVGTLLAFTPDSSRVVSYDLCGFTVAWGATSEETSTEVPKYNSKGLSTLFYISKDGWVCGPVGPSGPFKRLVWLPPNRRTKECWFREGVLTTVSSGGSVTQLDISGMLNALSSGEREV